LNNLPEYNNTPNNTGYNNYPDMEGDDRSPNIIDDTYNAKVGPIIEKRQTHYIFPFDPRPEYDVISGDVFLGNGYVDELGLVKTRGLLEDDDEDKI